VVLALVVLGEFDGPILDLVDSAELAALRADDGHVFANFLSLHGTLLSHLT
jgi:hypothetical protein